MSDRTGQQFGNYRLIRLVGQGAFADVYLAEHIQFGSLAAIKILSMRLGRDNVEYFRTEAQTLARLIHPYIVRVLDFGIEGGTPYLALEYAPNGSLRQQHPKGTQVPLLTIASYVKQAADGLQFAHNKGLVHRDIKPENMLLGENHQILLSDFGIALIAQSSRSQTTQEMAGTIAYMAPEQIQGKPRSASDQYALGVVVYEWMSGDRPFHGTFAELCSQHLFSPPPSFYKRRPAISPEIEQVVQTALEKDPHRRFRSVQDFATTLEQVIQLAQPSSAHSAMPVSDISISNRPLTSRYPVAPVLQVQTSEPTDSTIPADEWPQTNLAVTPLPPDMPPTPEIKTGSSPNLATDRTMTRRVVVGGLIGAGGLAAVASSLTLLRLMPRASSSPLHSGSGVSTATTPSSLPLGTNLYTYRGHTNSKDAVFALSWSPDSTRIASAGGLDGTVQVWEALNGKPFYTYFGDKPHQVIDVAWSLDGQRIASAELGGRSGLSSIQVWNASNDKHIYTNRLEPSSEFWSTVAWMSNGTRIVSAGKSDGSVDIWFADTGVNVLIYQEHSSYVQDIAWTPKGSRIASASQDKTVQVWEATTGNKLLTYFGHVDSQNGVFAVAWSPDGTRIASSALGENTVQVWEATTGNKLLTYFGHMDSRDGISALTWSPNGKYIASSSGNVQIWEANTGNHVYTYYGHLGTVSEVVWSPNGKYIASGGWDKTVQIWQAP